MTVHPKMDELANEFASTFALFEYALKAAGHCRSKRIMNRDIAEPDWSDFVQKNADVQKLMDQLTKDDTCKYIIDNPPKHRTWTQQNGFGWEDPCAVNNIDDLWYAVKRVRNNFFHGDKTVWDPTRDPQLLMAGLAVIDALLDASPGVKQRFELGLETHC